MEKRKLIVKTFQDNPLWTFKKIAREVKSDQRTVSSAIKRFQESLDLQRKPGSGRKKGFHSPKKAKVVVAKLQQNPSLSIRKLANKAQTSEATVRRVKKSVGLKTYKVQKIPDRNATKNLEAKNRARKLKSDFFLKNECCVMDDETYVLADFSQLPGQECYSAVGRGNVEEKFRTQKKSKFPKKYLVWQAICSCGDRSQSFITTGTINSEIYVKECLQKRLLPFIRQHKGSTFFWPDLASCHYGKVAIKWYNDNNIKFVPKDANPPNTPELRPVERYWAFSKKKLKERKKVAKTIEEFKRNWKTASEKVSKDTIQGLMAGIPGKITEFCKKSN